MARSGNPNPSSPRFQPGNKWRNKTRGLPGVKAFGEMIKESADLALKVIVEILLDKSAKDSVRLDAAKYVIDRVHGKLDAIKDISPQDCVTALTTAQLEQMIIAETKRLEAKL